MLQTTHPGQGTLKFLHHRKVAAPRDFGEMCPVLCESVWLSIGILRRLCATSNFAFFIWPGYICLLYLLYGPWAPGTWHLATGYGQAIYAYFTYYMGIRTKYQVPSTEYQGQGTRFRAHMSVSPGACSRPQTRPKGH